MRNSNLGKFILRNVVVVLIVIINVIALRVMSFCIFRR